MPESISEQKGLASPVTPKHYNYIKSDCKLSDLTQNGYYYIDDKIYRKDAPEGLTNYNLVVFNNGFVIQLLHVWQSLLFYQRLLGRMERMETNFFIIKFV